MSRLREIIEDIEKIPLTDEEWDTIQLVVKEVHRLRAAIEKHRLDLTKAFGPEGQESIPFYEIDEELYKALEEEK